MSCLLTSAEVVGLHLFGDGRVLTAMIGAILTAQSFLQGLGSPLVLTAFNDWLIRSRPL